MGAPRLSPDVVFDLDYAIDRACADGVPVPVRVEMPYSAPLVDLDVILERTQQAVLRRARVKGIPIRTRRNPQVRAVIVMPPKALDTMSNGPVDLSLDDLPRRTGHGNDGQGAGEVGSARGGRGSTGVE